MIRLTCGDCLDVLPTIAPGSVDLILADPPYGITSCKWDSVIDLAALWPLLHRAAKPNAAIVMTASQPFTTTLIASNIKNFKYAWVWDKRAAANFAAAKYQPLKIHEDIVVFKGLYRPLMTKGEKRMKGGRKATSGDVSKNIKPHYHESDLYYPKSILTFKGERGYHPTQKPIALMEYMIKTYTNEGETVLDFTMGSGSTGVAAKNLKRSFIGIEIDPAYCEIAGERIGAPVNYPTALW